VPLWKLTPAAAPDDPRWQDRTIWSEVIVEAPTAAFARQFAADWDLPKQLPQVGNESPSPKSGFQDEKLYWARRVADEEARHLSLAGDGTSPVLRAVEQRERPKGVIDERRPIEQ
jgi:hypothetical protein